jgi:hypothetical protein
LPQPISEPVGFFFINNRNSQFFDSDCEQQRLKSGALI